MGHYNLVVEDDEDVVWEEDEVGKVTHVLLVGFIRFFFFQTLVQIMSRKMTASMLLPLRFHHHSISILFL